jgi:hypothetical protein
MADMLARHQMEVCVQESLLFSFSMIFNITEREYCISSVSLLHTCEEEARQKRLPVSSGYLKNLPTLHSMLEKDKKLSAHAIERAIKADIPISDGEFQQMRGGIGSALYRTLKQAQEVQCISFF